MPKARRNPKSRDRRSFKVVVPAALMVVTIFGVAAVVASSGDEPEAARLVAAGDAPFSLAASDDHLWVGNAGDLSVSRLELATGEPTGEPIPLPVRPGQIAAGEQVWVGAIEGSDIVRIDAGDPETPPVPIAVGRDPAALALDGSDVWVAALNEGLIVRLSSEGEITDEITELEFPSALAFRGSDLWATDVTEGTVSRIDVGVGAVVESIDVGSGPTALAAGERRLWITLFRQDEVAVVNPDDGGVEIVELEGAPGAVAVGGGYVWVTVPERDSLIRIDPTSLEAAVPIPVGDNPQGVVVAGGAVWVANQGEDTVARIQLDSE
jgi:DNA-binding beta-propeller fold protein YncE